jgi:hypothetical protein
LGELGVDERKKLNETGFVGVDWIPLVQVYGS